MASASSAQEKESMPTILSLFDELPGLGTLYIQLTVRA